METDAGHLLGPFPPAINAARWRMIARAKGFEALAAAGICCRASATSMASMARR